MTGRHSVAAALLGALVWSIAGASPVRAQDQASMALEHRLTTAETLDRADDERVRGDLVVANQFYAARGSRRSGPARRRRRRAAGSWATR